MKEKQIDEMIDVLREELIQRRSPGYMWRGKLSSSAISTSVSVFALYMIDREKYASYIQHGAEWLKRSMHDDGSWGDSLESPSNLTATLLTYASLYAVGEAPEKAKEYLNEKFGGSTDQHIIKGVLTYYGTDLTFSAPILVMCALAGVITSWDKIPQLPFELSVFPQRLFRFFQLPVVSYAIPALIAVGILRYRKGKKNLFSPLRESFIPKSLKVLEKLQPDNGGFLEAAPLTAFVAMCMTGAGYREHIATQRAAGFLTNTVREDGAWPIDTDLASWVTALSVRALGDDITDKERLAKTIKLNAFTFEHPFTGAKEGGWAWTDLPGAVPDADDTSGALVALHILQDGVYCPEVGKGIEWLLALQNSDGGMPTFCKGWGKLPFDRSSPDISAHSLLAFELWLEVLPVDLQQRCKKSIRRMLNWMRSIQAADGSWTPLWFGDQNANDERSPVYGTAMTVEYLSTSGEPVAQEMIGKGLQYILSTQNEDGGWGGAKDVASKVTLTSRALSALASFPDSNADVMERAFDFLYRRYQEGELFRAEPIGLYFSRLWYSEELYNITFALNAIKKYRKFNVQN
ncbi:prenyltransferase/squalene oxidase repeat-containing protein [Parabacteroides sp. PF5-9]|uniref:prenyltransferase/squalene oxidase repeat-containing protein n=1 Tax=Parabacteroides sp. PF5-9 TaxID=1742404 RepID=UPI00247640A3|nr:prenyltransferase/squalene oxidase repeat-containing protein [Parabacteroides sp. PF5-9]MDH6358471.1 prenyltransferase beta subunit [Parabacteroides sp. PF5-9]